MKVEIDVEVLINERARAILAFDDAYPDVGMGMSGTTARREAIEALIAEKILLEDYEGK